MNFSRNLLIVSVLLSLIGFASGCCQQGKSQHRNPYNLDLTQTIEAYNRQVSANPQMEMADIGKSVKGIVMDIRYATPDNFTGEKIYTSAKAFARKPVVEALQKMEDSLACHHLGLKIYDAYRPYAATVKFFEVYPDTNFVANPRHGSKHNRGCAVDVSLVELSSGKEIPMPTRFDDFSEKAAADFPNLPDTVLTNRKLLSGVMAHFGFLPYQAEWWHYDFSGWENYKLMDLSFGELEDALGQNQK